ncbi:MAG: hypothetical protein HN337_05735 [Deltaproteobacteria bacterium]|jgi:hypothetical protein|nr:hypothetical protein [Deltaproteobacteria bacterium]
MRTFTQKILSIAILLTIALFCIRAEAAWLMIIYDDGVEDIQCDEGLRLISFSLDNEEVYSCIPNDVGMGEPPTQSTPSPSQDQQQSGDDNHEGPYQGTPLGGPLFN